MATNRPRSLQIFDPVLTGLSRSYRSHGYIADRLLPVVPVAKLSGQYPVFDKGYWFRSVDNRSSDRAPAREVDFDWSTETYLAEEYALKVSITDLERDQADGSLYLERSKTEYLTHQMLMAHEVRVAAFFDTLDNGGQFSNERDTTPSVNWDQDTATIEADIKAGVIDVYEAIGQVPNVIVIPYLVAYAMALQEDIRAILRYDAAGKDRAFLEVGDRVLPSVIHGMQVIIPQGAQLDSANEGGTESISEIWGNHVRLLYVDPSAKWGRPSAGYLLRHTPKRVTRWRVTDPDIEYIREMERYDLKAVAPDAIHVLRSVL